MLGCILQLTTHVTASMARAAGRRNPGGTARTGDSAIMRQSRANAACPLTRSLNVIGDGWTMLIVREALIGYRRFEDFRQHLGIARNILSRRLRHLETHRILERRRYQTRPPRYEYVLTAKGKDLAVALMALAQWGNRWSTAGDGTASVRFRNARTGAPLEARIVDSRTGDTVGHDETIVLLPDGRARQTGGVASTGAGP